MQKCIWYSPPTFLLCGLTPQFSPIILKKIMLKASENRKFRASKKSNVGFFAQGLRQ